MSSFRFVSLSVSDQIVKLLLHSKSQSHTWCRSWSLTSQRFQWGQPKMKPLDRTGSGPVGGRPLGIYCMSGLNKHMQQNLSWGRSGGRKLQKLEIRSGLVGRRTLGSDRDALKWKRQRNCCWVLVRPPCSQRAFMCLTAGGSRRDSQWLSAFCPLLQRTLMQQNNSKNLSSMSVCWMTSHSTFQWSWWPSGMVFFYATLVENDQKQGTQEGNLKKDMMLSEGLVYYATRAAGKLPLSHCCFNHCHHWLHDHMNPKTKSAAELWRNRSTANNENSHLRKISKWEKCIFPQEIHGLHYTMKLIILTFQVSGQVGGACVPIIQMSPKSVICNHVNY